MSTTRVVARAVILALAANLAGCATQPWAVQPVHVSSTEYSSYDCKELLSKAEAVAIQRRQITDALQTKANKDAALLTVNIISAFFIFGGVGLDPSNDGKFEEEGLGRLKGEAEALTRALKERHCDISKPVEARSNAIPGDVQSVSLPVSK